MTLLSASPPLHDPLAAPAAGATEVKCTIR